MGCVHTDPPHLGARAGRHRSRLPGGEPHPSRALRHSGRCEAGPDLARGPARRPARAVSPSRPPAGSGCFGCSAARGRCLVPGGPGLGARGLRRAAADVRARLGRPSRGRGRGFDGNGHDRPGFRVAVVVGLAVVLTGGIAWIGRPRPAPLSFASDACNGAPELCGRRLDEVVFPARTTRCPPQTFRTGCSRSRSGGIPRQLQDGIRALLFDVHYGVPVEGRVKTDIDQETRSRAKLDQAVGKEGVDAAMRIRDRLAGKAEGARAAYLCHGFCELGRRHSRGPRSPPRVPDPEPERGADPGDRGLRVAPGSRRGVRRKRPRRPRLPKGAPPALADVARDDRHAERVLVLTESGRPGIAWIHPAFLVMQETPYHFKEPSELSCAPNRGGTQGSLFLMNNWIDTTPAPKPSNAAVVNAQDALLGRARDCEAKRKIRPTVVAVDFYKTGDLFRVVRNLNGVAPGLAPRPHEGPDRRGLHRVPPRRGRGPRRWPPPQLLRTWPPTSVTSPGSPPTASPPSTRARPSSRRPPTRRGRCPWWGRCGSAPRRST